MMGSASLLGFIPHHAGIIVSDLDTAMKAFIRDLGYRFYQLEVNEKNSTLSGSSASFALRFGIGQLGLNTIELIQPVAGATLYSQHLAQAGPGLHHLAYSTTDLGAARKQFDARGYACIESGSIRGLVDFTCYNVKEIGCVVEPLQFSCDLFTFLLQNAQPFP